VKNNDTGLIQPSIAAFRLYLTVPA